MLQPLSFAPWLGWKLLAAAACRFHAVKVVCVEFREDVEVFDSCALSHWPLPCSSAWHKQHAEGRRSREQWLGAGRGALLNMTPRYPAVGPRPVPRTSDSISGADINASLGSTFWIIEAVCRHPATSCQQHRLPVCLSVRLIVLLHCRKQAVRTREHLILFYYYQTVPIITP